MMNPFSTLVQRKQLDRDLFSLQLPRDEKDTGELLFGGVDRNSFLGNLQNMPLAASDEGTPRLWAVKANSMNLGSGFINLDGYIASFETDYPFIGLPAQYVARLNRYMSMESKHSNNPLSIDCSKRRQLKNLTITLSSEDFIISPWDYTIETQLSEFEEGEKRCISAFAPVPEGEKRILLGSVFLRNFYGVFDLDGQSISCKIFCLYILNERSESVLTEYTVARLRGQRIEKDDEFDIQEFRRSSRSRRGKYS